MTATTTFANERVHRRLIGGSDAPVSPVAAPVAAQVAARRSIGARPRVVLEGQRRHIGAAGTPAASPMGVLAPTVPTAPVSHGFAENKLQRQN